MAQAWWRDSDYRLFYRLSQERDDAMAEIERLKAALPYDWNMLEACRGSLREHMAEIKRLKADNERLRGLLREAREYLPEHHPIAESLFSRIDAAMEPAMEPAIRARGEVPR